MRFLSSISILLIIIGCSNERENQNAQIKSQVQILKSLADSSYQISDYRGALNYLNQLIIEDSTQGELFYKRAYSKVQLLDHKSAAFDFQKSIQLGYRPADSYYNLGLGQILLLNDSMAIVYFEKSLEFNPNDVQVASALSACRNRVRGG